MRFDPARSYAERLRLIDHLSEAHPYPHRGTRHAWPDARDGIRMQTAWQRDSGRNPRGADGRLDGWWPNVNYTLTAWQMLALQKNGRLPNAPLIHRNENRFQIPRNVEHLILMFYDELARVRHEAETGKMSRREREHARNDLQRMLWDYHQAALDVGIPRNADVLTAMPEGERHFAVGWGTTWVQLLGIANFPTDEQSSRPAQQLLLPHRYVQAGDYDLGGGSDLPASVRNGIRMMRAVHEFETAHRYPLTQLLLGVKDVRLARVVLKQIATSGNDVAGTLFRVLHPQK